MKYQALRFPPELIKKITEHAKITKTTFSQAVRQLLGAGLLCDSIKELEAFYIKRQLNK